MLIFLSGKNDSPPPPPFPARDLNRSLTIVFIFSLVKKNNELMEFKSSEEGNYIEYSFPEQNTASVTCTIWLKLLELPASVFSYATTRSSQEVSLSIDEGGRISLVILDENIT